MARAPASAPHRHAKALRWLSIEHIRTKPCMPKTKDEADRLVQTALG